MFGVFVQKFISRRIVNGIIPDEMQARIVVAVIGVALPVTRQPDRVWHFFKTSVADELGGEPTLDALEHELVELPVELWADFPFDPFGIDNHAGGRNAFVR